MTIKLSVTINVTTSAKEEKTKVTSIKWQSFMFSYAFLAAKQ